VWYNIFMVLEGFKKKLFIQIGIALGASVLFSTFIILLNIDINSRADKIQNSKLELALREKTNELLGGATSDNKKAAIYSENLKTIFPNREQQIAFRTLLINSGPKYGVIVDYQMDRPVKPDVPVGFTITAKGDFDNVVNFLKFVESHKYILVMNSVSASRAENQGNFLVTIKGVIYTSL